MKISKVSKFRLKVFEINAFPHTKHLHTLSHALRNETRSLLWGFFAENFEREYIDVLLNKLLLCVIMRIRK